MDRHIRKTKEAEHVIWTRAELVSLLKLDEQVVDRIVSSPATFYSSFSIPKANGELREIRPPNRTLRVLQRLLLREFLKRVEFRSCLHGSIRGRSAVSHARVHVGRQMVATLDVRKFFPSTTVDHVAPVIHSLGFLGQAADDLIALLTLNDQVPQGGPASSLLANLAFAKSDSRFIELCRARRLRYTRYVDDIAVSGDQDFTELKGPFIEAIQLSRYCVAAEKIQFIPRSKRQVITGLVVNDKLRPTTSFLRQLRRDIHKCLEVGANGAALQLGITPVQLKRQLSGRVAYVRSVDCVVGNELRRKLFGIDWRGVSKREIVGAPNSNPYRIAAHAVAPYPG